MTSLANKEGAFLRPAAKYRNWIGAQSRFPAQPGRYHLYVAYACPWANRTMVVRKLKGLEDIIGMSIVHSTWQRTRPDKVDDLHTGWKFVKPTDSPLASSFGYGEFPCDGCVPDTVNDATYVRDLYELSDPGDWCECIK
jgi:putative glutathione S-transferase